MAEGRCFKCKEQRTIVDGKEVTMKNGRPALKGKCKECGTTIFKIVKVGGCPCDDESDEDLKIGGALTPVSTKLKPKNSKGLRKSRKSKKRTTKPRTKSKSKSKSKRKSRK